MMAQSAKSHFKALSGGKEGAAGPREENDFYPTPPDVFSGLLRVEGWRLRSFPAIWESAAGDGTPSDAMEAEGYNVIRTDLIDRGAGADLCDYFDLKKAPSPCQVTNPPYKEVNARDSKGRWLTHGFDIGCEYIALFLNWDWPAAMGLAEVMVKHPISRIYVCRWKVDFTGNGAPPQRNAWFIWDKEWKGEPVLRFLDRKDPRQKELKL